MNVTEKGIIMFDVDGTLIDYDDNPRQDVLDYMRLKNLEGYTIGVWSGGGREYADMWVRRLKIDRLVSFVMAKDRRAPEGTVEAVDDIKESDFGCPLKYVGIF